MKSKTVSKWMMLILLLGTSFTGFSQVRLPRLISDGMVLQRGNNTKIWGWAGTSEKVHVDFMGKEYNATAGSDGKWYLTISLPDAGGPYDMNITASNKITIKNILVGDVWVCSGQSNMELPMRRVRPLYEKEIADCGNHFIRCFTVPQKYNFNKPLDDLSAGAWVEPNPTSVLDFSAVAYFFARELYDKYKIPVGIINASLGGSPAEAWISEESLKVFPGYYNEALKFRDSSLIASIEKSDYDRMRNWYSELNRRDEGYKVTSEKWSSQNLDFSGWPTTKIPGLWSENGPGTLNGVVWFAKKIVVPASMVNKEIKLNMGRIVDADSVFINGVFIGTTSYQYPPRRYTIPAGVLKEGENNVVVRVISNAGTGGFIEDKKYEIICNNEAIDLTGDWHYKRGAVMDPLPSQTFIRWKPLGLFNAMIAPLTNYRIKGVIWYQGESNTGKPTEYSKLLSTLITDWRKNWAQGDFPFLLVQLPNFMEVSKNPGESNWAMLRESQADVLEVPNTGMAVTIDLGEWNDIHPLNKKDVAKRLVLQAEHVAYNESGIVFSGPVFKSMKINGKKVILSFDNIGSGLMIRGGGEPRCFAIAGADKKFIWANAKIKNNKVVVWNDNIEKPLYVRYAWADNPGVVILYNKEGLPAAPFRTDK
jgi:sialate O-acetylesterase